MANPETVRSIARNLRRLAEDANEELAAELLGLAKEYDRMADEVAPIRLPVASPTCDEVIAARPNRRAALG